MNFQGKTVLVSGGAMGIGSATSKRLASDGAFVIIADIDEKVANEKVEDIKNSVGQAYFQLSM